MKKILFIVSFAVVFASCGNNGGNGSRIAGTDSAAAHIHDGDCDHEHAHITEEQHDHDAGHADEGAHADHEAYDDCGTVAEHNHGSGECQDDGDADSHGHSHGADAYTEADEIIFPASQAARTDFEVSRVVPGAFCEVIKTAGRIMPAQGDEISVVAPAAGIVKFAGNITEGSAIGGGGRMFYISSKNIASGDVLARNKAAYEKAKADFERAEKLLERNIVSQKEYDEVKLAYEEARNGYEALAGAGTDKGVAVSSPLGGYVYGLAVRDGDYVETGQVLAVVSQNRTLTLRADVSQKYLPRLSRVTGANFVTPYDNKSYRLADLNGRLLSVGRNTLAASSLVPVTFQFNNTASVIPGTVVEVNLLGAAEDNVITLPLTAVTEQQGLYYVYVQLDEEGYEKREVSLGADDGIRVKILSGVKSGERVVTRGAVNVKMAASSGAIPHGHDH